MRKTLPTTNNTVASTTTSPTKADTASTTTVNINTSGNAREMLGGGKATMKVIRAFDPDVDEEGESLQDHNHHHTNNKGDVHDGDHHQSTQVDAEEHWAARQVQLGVLEHKAALEGDVNGACSKEIREARWTVRDTIASASITVAELTSHYSDLCVDGVHVRVSGKGTVVVDNTTTTSSHNNKNNSTTSTANTATAPRDSTATTSTTTIETMSRAAIEAATSDPMEVFEYFRLEDWVKHAASFPTYPKVFLGSAASAVDLSLIHISEPTRLLSISYAVFCLKKKKKKYRQIFNRK
eukprot:TRINITY_DN5086_c0_g1_i1.p1 TRINITY_DN5086_c0_g1~~TRINITY_DN5086_c0_g1_i1.p1  ORF type:complete len:295 (+),score=100.65 TRINITY_DN5086_c0_g1_i1:266-1150(+)